MPFSAKIGFFEQQSAAVPHSYPDWPTQASTTQFTTEGALLSGTPSSAVTFHDPNSNIGTTEEFRGAVQHPNGNIYFLPRQHGSILELEPTTMVATDRDPASGIPTNQAEYTGGALGGNGNIYLNPFDFGSTLYEYDPTTQTATESNFGATINTGSSDRRIGAVTDSTGNVHCIPLNASTVIKVDCSTSPVTASNKNYGATWGSAGYVGGTAHPNGNVYCMPLNANKVLEFDPANETSRTVSTPTSATLQCQGAVTGADGKIYGVPYNADYVLVYDPDTHTVAEQTFGLTMSFNNAYIGGVSAPNGNIYMMPFDEDLILEIDPVANVASYLATSIYQDSGADKFVGGCSDESGNVYMAPNNEGSIGILQTNATGGTNANAYTLSSYTNRGF